MFDAGNVDSIVHRGIDEAFACQDMLARAPVTPSPLARVLIWIAAAISTVARHKPAPERRRMPVVPRGTVIT